MPCVSATGSSRSWHRRSRDGEWSSGQGIEWSRRRNHVLSRVVAGTRCHCVASYGTLECRRSLVDTRNCIAGDQTCSGLIKSLDPRTNRELGNPDIFKRICALSVITVMQPSLVKQFSRMLSTASRSLESFIVRARSADLLLVSICSLLLASLVAGCGGRIYQGELMYAAPPELPDVLILPDVPDKDNKGLVVPIGIRSNGAPLAVLDVAVVAPRGQAISLTAASDIYNGLAGWYAASGDGIVVSGRHAESLGIVENSHDDATDAERNTLPLLIEPTFAYTQAVWNGDHVNTTVFPIVIRLTRPLHTGEMVNVRFLNVSMHGTWRVYSRAVDLQVQDFHLAVEPSPR